VPDACLADNSKLADANPAPEDSSVSDLHLGDLLGLLHVEDLDDCGVTVGSTDSNDVTLFVHEDAVSLHVALIDLEALGGIDDVDGLKKKDNLEFEREYLRRHP